MLSGQCDDGGYSGGSMQRPVLLRLLADIEAGQVAVVVVYKGRPVDAGTVRFCQAGRDFDRVCERASASSMQNRQALGLEVPPTVLARAVRNVTQRRGVLAAVVAGATGGEIKRIKVMNVWPERRGSAGPWRPDYPKDLASWNSASALTNTPTAVMRARACT